MTFSPTTVLVCHIQNKLIFITADVISVRFLADTFIFNISVVSAYLP